MYAMDFYTSTCRFVMQADPDNPTTLVEIRRLLPCLRQALGCYVCFSLLKDPMGPNHNVCRHSVCLNCLGGKMKLKPACSWCKDHCQFVPNPLLKILVTCFKKLCAYIYSSQLGVLITNSSINGETNHLLQIIREGMDFRDDYISPSLNLQSAARPESETNESLSLSVDSVEEVTSHVPVEENGIEVPMEVNGIENLVDSAEEDITTKDVSSKEIEVSTSPSVELSDIKISQNRKRNSAKISDHNYENKLLSVVKNKTSKKPVIFLKRATLNRKKCKKVALKSALNKVKNGKKKKVAIKKFNTRRSKHEAPSDLERIDNSDTCVKKVKVELQPPELKPLSSCNCGKSGNFNQLTCIGQRCPCYSMKLPCVGCKCRGCRNPKKGPDYQGMNTILGSSTVLRSGTRNATESYT